MFNMGLGEILVILAVALIFVGPAKIPEIARTVGRGIGRLRRASDEVRDTIQSEIDALDREEIQKKIDAEKTAGGGAGPYAEKDPYVEEAVPQPLARPADGTAPREGAGAGEREGKRTYTTEAQSGGSAETQRVKGGDDKSAGADAGAVEKKSP